MRKEKEKSIYIRWFVACLCYSYYTNKRVSIRFFLPFLRVDEYWKFATLSCAHVDQQTNTENGTDRKRCTERKRGRQGEEEGGEWERKCVKNKEKQTKKKKRESKCSMRDRSIDNAAVENQWLLFFDLFQLWIFDKCFVFLRSFSNHLINLNNDLFSFMNNVWFVLFASNIWSTIDYQLTCQSISRRMSQQASLSYFLDLVQ